MAPVDLLGTPHEPITNTAVETAHPLQRQVSPPVPGQVEALAPTPEGTEPVAARVMPEVASAPTAPDVELPDIGAASFDGHVHLETVHGRDDRQQIDDTLPFPWSAIASLLITARDGSQWIGTGWFIGPRTLVTAGHCVYITGSSVPNRNGWVLSMQVMPGRNGSELPYGAHTATRFWTVRGWANGGDENYDYGAVVLGADVGATVGTFGFGVYEDADLTDRVVNVAGYPGDKPPGSLWYGTRTVASLSPSKVYYDIDTAGGQSGAGVYLVEGDQRIGVAVHAYGGPVTNSGTRITPPVFQNLSDWKA